MGPVKFIAIELIKKQLLHYSIAQTGDEWVRGRSGPLEITALLFKNFPKLLVTLPL